MKPAFAEFKRDLDDLGKLSHRTQLEQQVLAFDHEALPEDFRELFGSFKTAIEPFTLRRATYSTMVVLLYSSFEAFVDRIVQEYLEALSGVARKFEELPEQVKSAHRRKTLEALNDDAWLERQSKPDIATELIERLHLCEARLKNYRLNSAAFARHTANYRVASIDRAFASCGIPDFGVSVAHGPAFASYLAAAGSPERGLLDGSMGAIDDLAQRRNDVSHGSPSDMLGHATVDKYLAFFAALANGYLSRLQCELARYVIAYHSERIGRAPRVHYRSVVVLDHSQLPANAIIRVGDPIGMQRATDHMCELGRVSNLRTVAGDVQSVLCEEGVEVAVELSFRPREGSSLFLIQRDAPGVLLAEP